MTTYNFGFSPADFVEIPDPVNAGQVTRPAAGQVLTVTDAATGQPVTGLVNSVGSAITQVLTEAYGYFHFGCNSTSVVAQAANGPAKTLIGIEAVLLGVNAGNQAAAAVLTANNAQATATAARTGLQTTNGNVSTLQTQVNNIGPGTGGQGVLTVRQNPDGTWPARTTVTSSRTTPVTWRTQLANVTFPNISTGPADAVVDLDDLDARGG